MKLKITILLLLLVANHNIGQSQNQQTYASSITAEELKEKFFSLAELSLDNQQAASLFKSLASLEDCDDIKEIFEINYG